MVLNIALDALDPRSRERMHLQVVAMELETGHRWLAPEEIQIVNHSLAPNLQTGQRVPNLGEMLAGWQLAPSILYRPLCTALHSLTGAAIRDVCPPTAPDAELRSISGRRGVQVWALLCRQSIRWNALSCHAAWYIAA